MKRLTIVLFVVFAVFAFGCKGDLQSNQTCTPSCSGKACGADGCGGICGECGPGLSCSSAGACISSFCGNGSVDGEETCDSEIASGAGVCDTEESCVDDMNSCTSEQFFGSPNDCDAKCRQFTIIDCVDSDGCCPAGCAPANDLDCSANCDNGVIDDGETCDPPGTCPVEADCDDGVACTNDILTGAATTCSAQCANIEIEDCADDDGCCPPGCDENDDNDCGGVCGDGVVEGGEMCDNAIAAGMPGACPTVAADCDDTVACTTDTVVGMATDCSAACSSVNITACVNDDGCCPPTCNDQNDTDCVSVCGNGVVEGLETCDNAIPAGMAGECPLVAGDCDDVDACTTDTLVGMAGDCSAECNNTAIVNAVNNDMCCQPNTPINTDDDCDDLCSMYCGMAMQLCVAGDVIFADMATCLTDCTAFTFTVGDANDVVNDTLYCRINNLQLGIDNAAPATYCPYGSPGGGGVCQ